MELVEDDEHRDEDRFQGDDESQTCPVSMAVLDPAQDLRRDYGTDAVEEVGVDRRR